jgi:hypothetical protein
MTDLARFLGQHSGWLAISSVTYGMGLLGAARPANAGPVGWRIDGEQVFVFACFIGCSRRIERESIPA